ncbi:MAG: hypothetical protein J4F34_09070 [Gemmatimonadetes bacterium]|nr:hypothetical protein [Gemmatimonadota bacterium]
MYWLRPGAFSLRWRIRRLAALAVANRPEEPGTYTYPCPHGGEVEVTVTASEEQEDRLSGEWEIEIDECGPGGDPMSLTSPEAIYGLPTVYDVHFVFTSETVFFESGRRRFEAVVEQVADFGWRWGRERDSRGRLYSCDREQTDVSGVFEAGLDEPYPGLLEGIVCGGPVKIFVSDFPGS